MADRKYQLNFELSDGSTKQVQFVVPQGDPGETPEITIHEIAGGHQVVVTVGDKTNAFEVMDGEKGADGVTPTIEIPINKIPGGHEVYFVVNGEPVNSMLIMDGKDGEDGADGDGAGVTSWNDLEDRPFYNDEFEGYILPETSTGIDVYNKWRTVSQPFASGLILGESYTVSVNGMLCVVKAREIEHNGVVYVGLTNYDLGDDWMGAGFTILEVPADMVESIGAYAILPNSNYAENISIYGKGRRLKKIDPILLPDDVGGGVSSWNDLTDKPFGEVEKEGYIIPETTAILSNGEGYLSVRPAALWVSGRTYIVNWNGTDYNCIAMETSDEGATIYALGNMAMFGGDDTGEPFIIMALNAPVDGMYALLYDLSGANSATFSVYGLGEFIEPIAEKYLPTTIPRTAIVDMTIDGDFIVVNSGDFDIVKAAFVSGSPVFARLTTSEVAVMYMCVTVTPTQAVFANYSIDTEENLTLNENFLTLDSTNEVHMYAAPRRSLEKRI